MPDEPYSFMETGERVAIELLVGRGYTVIPPASGKPPKPEVGQRWVSPKPRVKYRTITRLGTSCYYGATVCIWFTVGNETQESYLPPWSWDDWVRKSGARPAP